MSYTIIWESKDSIFDNWGEEVDETTAANLNLGILYSQRKISWNDFLNQIGTAIGIATASPVLKKLIGALIIISMNAPKAKKITNEMVDTLRSAIKVNAELDYYVDIEDMERFGNSDEVKKVIQWFEKHKIGNLEENSKHLKLQSHVVHSMRIF